MKSIRIGAASLLTLAVASCASMNGGSVADTNADGVVSKTELIHHQRRLASGGAQQGYELQSLQHVEHMIGTTREIMNSLQNF